MTKKILHNYFEFKLFFS